MIEKHDMKTEEKNYREDLAAIREAERVEIQEMVRREWAQKNGNDSGYDPYAYL